VVAVDVAPDGLPRGSKNVGRLSVIVSPSNETPVTGAECVPRSSIRLDSVGTTADDRGADCSSGGTITGREQSSNGVTITGREQSSNGVTITGGEQSSNGGTIRGGEHQQRQRMLSSLFQSSNSNTVKL
jgi:hypothetical protein